MTNKEFDVILEQRITLMRQVLQKKAGEYASLDDRLHNFKRAAQVLGTTSEKALLGMLVKHLVSLFDIVDSWQDKKCSIEMLDEKIGDTINYAILLEALLKESLQITMYIQNMSPKNLSPKNPFTQIDLNDGTLGHPIVQTKPLFENKNISIDEVVRVLTTPRHPTELGEEVVKS
jgi:hypothetical protein